MVDGRPNEAVRPC